MQVVLGGRRRFLSSVSRGSPRSWSPAESIPDPGGARRSRKDGALCCPATLTCSAHPGLQAGTAQRARRMRLESPASPPALSRTRERGQCPASLPPAGLPPAGEGAMPGSLSRQGPRRGPSWPLERVGVRVFGCRNGFVPDEGERLRVVRSCPLVTPKGSRLWLQMLAIVQAIAAHYA